MTDELTELPIGEADRLAREKIEHHREEMSNWRRARAARVVQERDAGRSVAEVAAAMGVHPQVVYELQREARTVTSTEDQPNN